MEKETYYSKLMKVMNDEKHFNGFNGIIITKIEDFAAYGEMDYTESTQNPMGGIHGGALATLADSVAGLAAAARGFPLVTLSNTMNYMRPARPGKIYCAAKVVKSGRTIIVCDASIHDSEDRLIATGTFTFYANEKNLMEKMENEPE